MEFYDKAEDANSINTKRTRATCINILKPVLAIICVVVGISAVVVLAVEYSHPTSKQNTGEKADKFDCEPKPMSGKLKFNSSIEITCVYPSDTPINDSIVILEFIPETGPTEGIMEINSTVEAKPFRIGRWNIKIKESSVEFHADPNKCDENGYYHITLYSVNSTENFNDTVGIKYENEVSADQMDIRKSEKNGVYEITCSTSGYPPATIIIQRTIQNITYPLNSVNSSCVMGCNGNDGEQKRLIGKDSTTTPTPTYNADKIGFTAVTTVHQTHLMIDSTVHFPKVITNAGNGFDPITGIFRAPVPGLYLFSASILSLVAHEVRCEIAKNGDVVAYIFSGDNATYSTGTQSVLLDLLQNDEIWIKITHNNDVNILGGGWSSFVGVLISP